MDYVVPHLTLKSTVGLTQNPKVNISHQASLPERQPANTIDPMCAYADAQIDVNSADLNGRGLEVFMHAQIDLQATTGYKDFIFGGDATYDTAKQDVTKWATGVGMPHPIMLKHHAPALKIVRGVCPILCCCCCGELPCTGL